MTLKLPPIELPTKSDGDVPINGPCGRIAFLRKQTTGRGWHLRIDGIRDYSRFGNAKEIREDIQHFMATGSLPRGERW